MLSTRKLKLALKSKDNELLKELFIKPTSIVQLCANAESYQFTRVYQVIMRMVRDSDWFTSFIGNAWTAHDFLIQIKPHTDCRWGSIENLYKQLRLNIATFILTTDNFTKLVRHFNDLIKFCSFHDSNIIINFLLDNNLLTKYVTNLSELSNLCENSKYFAPKMIYTVMKDKDLLESLTESNDDKLLFSSLCVKFNLLKEDVSSVADNLLDKIKSTKRTPSMQIFFASRKKELEEEPSGDKKLTPH